MMDKLPVCSCGRTLPRCLMSGVVRCVCGAIYGTKTPSNLPQDESKDQSWPSIATAATTPNLEPVGGILPRTGGKPKDGRS